MTPNTEDPAADIAWMRRLAEEGADAPMEGASILMSAGLIYRYFKGKNEDIREIGKKLNVAHVVEGSVRRSGDRLRVTCQLVSVKNGFHLWSETYDRPMNDAFAIQTEIADGVAVEVVERLEAVDVDAEQAEARLCCRGGTERQQGDRYSNKCIAGHGDLL